MNFLSSKELSKKWGIGQCRIIRLAREGRIEGAKLYGKTWLFPENAMKPQDLRTKDAKNKKMNQTEPFRYPSFEYRDCSKFSPPLNEEEQIIKAVTEAIYACRFEEADRLLGDLPDKTVNRYRRLNALYNGCMIDIFLCNTERFFYRYNRMFAELQEAFPYKTEMAEYLHELHAILGFESYYAYEFKIDPDYQYHDTFWPRLANLSAVHLSFADKKWDAKDLAAHELNCFFLRKTANYADEQAVHLSLGVSYGIRGKRKEMKYHLSEALTLADKYEMYFNLADPFYYKRMLFNSVIEDFSVEFKNRLINLCEDMHHRFLKFMDAISMNNVYTLLTNSDYVFLYYAILGMTNKEVSERLHISVSTVGKKYSEIYAGLEVKGKKELKELLIKSSYKHNWLRNIKL